MSSTPLDRLSAIIGVEDVSSLNASSTLNSPESTSLEVTNEPTSSLESPPDAELPSKVSLEDSAIKDGISNIILKDGQGEGKKAKLDDKAQGEVGPAGEYCPIAAVSKFPYKYMDPKSTASDSISKGFFAENRFWNNVWTVYYVQVPAFLSAKPLLVIPRNEVERLLARISTRTGIRLHVPSESTGFVVSFSADDTPRPRYLGMSTCRDDFSRLEGSVPSTQLDFQIKKDGSILAKCDERSFEEWAAKIERAIEATKNKNRASKERRKQQRVVTKTDWSRQLRRAQTYLGLRAAAGPLGATTSAVVHESSDATNDPPGSSSLGSTVDMTRPISLCFHSDVVFISVDVEVYERNHNLVTEVGLAVLDTRDLIHIPPGDDGHRWMKSVSGRHFWLKEYSHLVNTDFVNGCPDRYEASFGATESVTIPEAVEALKECFRNPAQAKRRDGPTTLAADSMPPQSLENTSQVGDGITSASESQSCSPPKFDPTVPRKVVLVGHDINADIGYLKMINIDLLATPGVLEILDTSELYRTMKREDTSPSVSTMLYNLGITGWNLHNAGNDAAYTLQALIGIVVRSAAGGNAHIPDPAELISKAKQEAEERVWDNLGEWEVASGDADADSGEPNDPKKRATPKKGKQQVATVSTAT